MLILSPRDFLVFCYHLVNIEHSITMSKVIMIETLELTIAVNFATSKRAGQLLTWFS